MAPSRGLRFDGQLFFVYDRQAVTREEDPPENAIIYFSPSSAPIESRISICGQLVGISNFLSTVLHFAPVLINLKSEKVALCQSGRYTLALGGGISEPESLLTRQLETLFNTFVFYHGSLQSVRDLSKDQASFLKNMSIIWDCYLPFIRHYGNTLPAVFNPLPFLKVPKNSSGCFLKASHILQTCQRRHHILGGCIIHKNSNHDNFSVLCTQLETCITRRLLLLKPNQCHHPAKQVQTVIKLPYGVRILHSFITGCEYERLLKAFLLSPYHHSKRDCTASQQQQHLTSSKSIKSDKYNVHLEDTTSNATRNGQENKLRKEFLLEKESSKSTVYNESNMEDCKDKTIAEEKAMFKVTVSDSNVQQSREIDQKSCKLSHENDVLDSSNCCTYDEYHESCIYSNVDACKELLLGDDDLTMDEIDIKGLRIVKGNALLKNQIVHESQDDEVEICNELIESLVKQVCTECESSIATNCKTVCKCSSLHDSSSVSISGLDKRTSCCSLSNSLPLAGNSSSKEKANEQNEENQVQQGMTLVPSDGVTSVYVESHKENQVQQGMILVPSDGVTSVYVESHEENQVQQGMTPVPSDGVTSVYVESHKENQVQQGMILVPSDGVTSVYVESHEENQVQQGMTLVPSDGVTSVYVESHEENQVQQGMTLVPSDGVTSVYVESHEENQVQQGMTLVPSDGVTPVYVESHEENQVQQGMTPVPSGVNFNCDKKTQLSTEQGNNIHPFPITPKGLHFHGDQLANTSTSPEEPSRTEDYHDTIEDLVTDSEETMSGFDQRTVYAILQNYQNLKASGLMVNKYSLLNLSQHEDKKIEKDFFKDLIRQEEVSSNTVLNKEVRNQDGQLNHSSSLHQDSCRPQENVRESGLSYSISSESPAYGCSGNCQTSLGDSGLCLFHGSSESSFPQAESTNVNPTNPGFSRLDSVDSLSEFSSPSELDLGVSSNTIDAVAESMEQKQDEQADTDDMDNNIYQIDELVHINLYVQAHSNTVLILLADSSLSTDQETIKALWKTTLNELGELEVHLNQCTENPDHTEAKPDECGILVYETINKTTRGNLTEPVLQVDHKFCETAKTIHEQFTNCASLKAITLRDNTAAVHCQRSFDQEVYFHKKGPLKPFRGSPSLRDSAFGLEKRARKQLRKDYDINVF